MAKLDFSGINGIAYKGFTDQAARDSLIDQGFTVMPDDDENPFSGETAAGTGRLKTPAIAQRAFSNAYNSLYREAHDFHEKHYPPMVDLAYWREHEPGKDGIPPAEEAYWKQTAKDAASIANRYEDPFLTGLLCTVYGELERKYKESIARA